MIIYNTLLNRPSLKEYGMALVEMGLLAYDIPTRPFKTTEKGVRFPQVFSELNQNLKNNKNNKK